MWKKKISILVLVILIQSSVFTYVPVQKIYGAVIGDTGSIPAGGTIGKDGGMCPATVYRIGITSEAMLGNNVLDSGDDNAEVVRKLERHYANHFPKMENSIMFAPSNCYATSAAIGWFEASSGELRMVRHSQDPVLHSARLRLLTPTNTDPGRLYYNALVSRAPLDPRPNKQVGDVSTLIDGGWKNVIYSVGTNGASGIWNYLLGNSSQMIFRIKEYIGEADMDSNDPVIRQRGRMKYLDLLMTLYALYPAGSQQREFYDEAIERFLKKDNLNERPIVFSIDTAVRFSAPAVLGSGNFVYIPSTDYIQWMHGAAPKSLITSPDFQVPSGSQWNSEAIIELGAKRSMAELPKRQRNTDKPSDRDGFTWAYGGVVGKILRTNTSAGTVN